MTKSNQEVRIEARAHVSSIFLPRDIILSVQEMAVFQTLLTWKGLWLGLWGEMSEDRFKTMRTLLRNRKKSKDLKGRYNDTTGQLTVSLTCLPSCPRANLVISSWLRVAGESIVIVLYFLLQPNVRHKSHGTKRLGCGKCPLSLIKGDRR